MVHTQTHTVVKQAQQRLFSLRRLNRFDTGPQILKKFYSCTIDSILTGYTTAWYGNCNALKRKALQRMVWTPQNITGVELPTIQVILYQSVSEEGPENCQKTSDTQAMGCSLCYHLARGIGASDLGPTGAETASTPKQ